MKGLRLLWRLAFVDEHIALAETINHHGPQRHVLAAHHEANKEDG